MSKVVKAQLWDGDRVRATVEVMADDIVAAHNDIDKLAIVGIRTRGEFIARRVAEIITTKTKAEVKLGIVDVTFHRDDFRTHLPHPEVGPSQIPFAVDDLAVVVIDDVLYTGRTIRAAINSIMDFGRPAAIELAVLVDRGGRELPISANFIGLEYKTADNEHIHVHVQEVDEIDEILLLEYES